MLFHNFFEDARGWRLDPSTHYMQSRLQFGSFVFDGIAGVARILKQTWDKPFRSFSEANKSLAIVGHMLSAFLVWIFAHAM